MSPTTTATEATTEPDLRELSRIAALDGWRHAAEQPAHRDAGMWHWIRSYLLDHAQADDPATITARVLGIADALDDLRAAGAGAL